MSFITRELGSGEQKKSAYLKFPLDAEDGWPPVGVEGLPFEKMENGFRALVPPLFIKDLSVGDVISVELGEDDLIEAWAHLHRSGRSTIWLLRQKKKATPLIAAVLLELESLGCFTADLESLGCYAIDVPESINISQVDEILAKLDETSCAVAFPSMRHSEDSDD